MKYAFLVMLVLTGCAEAITNNCHEEIIMLPYEKTWVKRTALVCPQNNNDREIERQWHNR